MPNGYGSAFHLQFRSESGNFTSIRSTNIIVSSLVFSLCFFLLSRVADSPPLLPGASRSFFASMKIEKANVGGLTNFEVFDFLRSRGATSDPMGCLGSVAPSECKVFEYLNRTPACTQTRESVNEFLAKADKFKITISEKLNIINLVPRGQPELYGMIKDCEKRLVKMEEQIVNGEKEMVPIEDHAQELLELVEEIFPQPAAEPQEEPQEELSQ